MWRVSVTCLHSNSDARPSAPHGEGPHGSRVLSSRTTHADVGVAVGSPGREAQHRGEPLDHGSGLAQRALKRKPRDATRLRLPHRQPPMVKVIPASYVERRARGAAIRGVALAPLVVALGAPTALVVRHVSTPRVPALARALPRDLRRMEARRVGKPITARTRSRWPFRSSDGGQSPGCSSATASDLTSDQGSGPCGGCTGSW